MKKLVVGIVALLVTLSVTAVAAAHVDYWSCKERQADGQCIIRVAIAGSFSDIDHQVIREVLADFSRSPNIEAIEDKPSDVSVLQGCYKSHICGALTDMGTRKVYIDRGLSYATFCCNEHDGMRGVYCHELMHAIGGIGDFTPRSQPSCFNGTSPYLGPEDFADIAVTYPLPA